MADEIEDNKNTNLTIREVSGTHSIAVIKNLEEIDKMVDSVANSVLGDPFRVKGSDGKMTVNRADIVANIIMGHELGLAPMNSVALGRKLNLDTYLSVIKGKTLGVDPITAMDKIWNIKGMITAHTDIICKVMLDNGVYWETVENFVPVYAYLHGSRVMSNDECLDSNDILKDKFVIIYPTTTADDIKKIIASNKVPITKKEITRRTTIKFTRPDKHLTKTDSMTLQEAPDEGVYVGYHSTLVGNDNRPLYVKGSDGWNKHPVIRLEGRLLARNGRKLVADKLTGVYDVSEIPADSKLINIDYEEVK